MGTIVKDYKGVNRERIAIEAYANSHGMKTSLNDDSTITVSDGNTRVRFNVKQKICKINNTVDTYCNAVAKLSIIFNKYPLFN